MEIRLLSVCEMVGGVTFTALFLLLCMVTFSFCWFSCTCRQLIGHCADWFPKGLFMVVSRVLLDDGAISTFIFISSLCFAVQQPTHMAGNSLKSIDLIGNFLAALHSVTFAYASAYMFHISLAVIIVDLPGHMVNNRGEVGGSIETHRFETLVIGLHHPLDTTAVWVLWITILHKNRKTKWFVSVLRE